MSVFKLFFSLIAAILLTACASSSPRATLYQDLGGEAGVRALVAALETEVKNDTRINELFAETEWEYLSQQLNVQICQISDGGCTYDGLDMVEAHSGMDIRPAEVNYFVENLQQAMAKLGRAQSTQNRLLQRLAAMHGDIVGQ